MSRLLSALLVIALAGPGTLLCQTSASTASIGQGARVRISQVGQKPRIGVVVTPGADTLLVRWQEYTSSVAVPIAEISRLEVSNGRHRKVAKGALVGTLTGGAAGAMLGAATYSPCTSKEAFGCLLAPTARSEAVAVGGVLGGTLGLLVGTLAGLPSRESWHRVSLDARRVAVAVKPGARGTDLGVTLRF